MIILVLGPANSGKSRYAEKVSAGLSLNEHGELVYIATMIPVGVGDFGDARVLRHRKQREGLGFKTVEMPLRLYDIPLCESDTVLLEDAANLLANYMFCEDENGNLNDALTDITAIAAKCKNIVVVSLGGVLESGGYDNRTNEYVSSLRDLNARLAELADVVAVAGEEGIIIKKGGFPSAFNIPY